LKIFAHYATLDPLTAEFLDRQRNAGHEVHMESSGNLPYYEAFRRVWCEGEAFINIEHDIVPPDLQSLWECEKDWCVHPYYVWNNYIANALGCTKFSRHLLRTYPHLVCGLNYDKGWRTMDSHLYVALTQLGYVPHVHTPLCHHTTRERAQVIGKGICPGCGREAL
jgi:hypothetical protein